jgi:2-keto-4-pentenoate hydratase/2-oxohepta-3-ene-1,7-dioic acid hydratase in catechol pathway
MRIATVRAAGAERAVAADADVYRRLDASGGLADLLRAGVDPRHLRLGEPVDGQLAARLRPGKVVAIGLNYLDHIRESNLEHPTRPLVFAKFRRA